MIDFSELFNSIKSETPAKLVLANGIDIHSLTAVAKAVQMNIVQAAITGNKSEIEKKCMQIGFSFSNFELIDTHNEHDAISKAVDMVSTGKAGILMKGMVNTDVFMRAVLDKEKGLLPKGNLLTHIALIKNDAYHKPLFVSDVAIIPSPTLEQKAEITRQLIRVAQQFGIKSPRVAFLAASEKIIDKMDACTHASALTQMYRSGRFAESVCYGPMALDLALDVKAAEIKKFESEVAGNADCLLFPNIESGNVFYKTNTLFCNAQIAAILVGASVPVVLSSRGDSVQTKLNSIAFAVITSLK